MEQDGKVVSTFSRKFNDAQLKYTCKHVGPIICGCDIRIHTDHQNPTHKSMEHVNLREQRALVFLDADFAPTSQHIAVDNNTDTDGLSRLPMADKASARNMHSLFVISHLDRDDNMDFPLDMK